MVGPRKPLSGRFAFQGFLKSQREAARWLAVESETGRRVVAVLAEASRLANLERARGVVHRHLAGLVEAVRKVDAESVPDGITVPSGAGVAVTEFVPGRTLRHVLGGKPMSSGKAVAWTLRLIEAVQALHAKGALHGSISPWSVLAEPEGRAIAPVLSQLVAPPIGAFCPPERLKGAAESKSDDVWALHALLYTMLTGKPPFSASTREALAKQMLLEKPKSLAEQGVDEPVLAEILERGLIGERRLRVTELTELSRALDGWERDPRAMPAKRPVLPRPAPRALMDIAAGTGPSAARDSEIVIDDSVLPDDEGTERATSAGTSPRPALPVAPPLRTAPIVQVSSPPPLPQVSVPPPLPQVSVPPPLPQVSVPPPLPQSSASTLRVPPPLPSQAGPASSLGDFARDVHTVSAVVAPVPIAPPARRLSVNPFERKRKAWPLVVLAAALSGGGVYLAVGTGKPEVAVPASPAPAAAPAVAKAPVKRKSATEDRDACVRSYFPDDAFAEAPSFEAVCSDADFRDVSRGLFANAGATPAARSSANLGWYELPAAAIIRKGCCPGTSPVILPETAGWCEQLQDVVRRIADDSSKAGDLAPVARTYDKAVSCLFANRISRPYVYERPNAAQRRAFQEFLSRAAISEARR